MHLGRVRECRRGEHEKQLLQRGNGKSSPCGLAWRLRSRCVRSSRIAHVGGCMILAPIQTLVAEIGSMFGSGEERPATIMGTIGVQLATPTRRGLLNRSGFPLLLILFMALKCWSACTEGSFAGASIDIQSGLQQSACQAMSGGNYCSDPQGVYYSLLNCSSGCRRKRLPHFR